MKRDITLDELAAGNLPEHVLQAIESMEVSLGELVEFVNTQPKFRIAVQDGFVAVDLRIRLPVRTLALVAIAVSSPLWPLAGIVAQVRRILTGV